MINGGGKETRLPSGTGKIMLRDIKQWERQHEKDDEANRGNGKTWYSAAGRRYKTVERDDLNGTAGKARTLNEGPEQTRKRRTSNRKLKEVN